MGLCTVVSVENDGRAREKMKNALRAYFERHSLPRLTLSIVLLGAGLAGLGISHLLLGAGMEQMWLRYPLSVVGAYLVLLCLLRIWVEIEKRRFDPTALDAKSAPPLSKVTTEHSKWTDWLDVPDFGSLDEGCLPFLLIAACIGLLYVIFVFIAAAPILIAEVFLDAFIVAVLYRRLKKAGTEDWLGTAIRQTWWHVLATAALLSFIGWGLQILVPDANSVGPAAKVLFARWFGS